MPHSMGHAIIRMKNGITTSFEAMLSEAPLSQQPWFIIQCEGGEIVIDGAFDGGFGVKIVSKEHPTGLIVTESPQGWSTSYSAQMSAFLRRCSGHSGVADVESANEGLKDLELLLGMIKSSESGSWVKLC
jgi:predicted dehydrogenase